MAGRLVLAMPLYLSVSVNWFCRFLSLDHSPVVDYLAVRKVYLSAAMTRLFEQALDLEADWDRIVIYEADMLPPRNALVRISNYPDELDIVGTLYHQHVYPYRPMVFEQVDETHYRNMAHDQIAHMTDKPGCYPVGGIGFGLTSIHRRVLEKWDPEVPFFAQDVELMGHDLWFCRGAKRQGFSVHVDTAISSGHLTEMSISNDDYRRAVADELESAKE